MWLRIALPLGALALVLVALFFFMQDSSSNASPLSCRRTPAPRVVALGDSLVYGYGAQTTGGFVPLVSAAAGVPIANAGVNGDTTDDVLARLPSVLAQKPDIVILLVGGNDALHKVPQATTEANFEKIISLLQGAGTRVLLVGVLGGYPSDPYASMFSKLSKSYDVPLVPNILSGLILHSAYMSDEVHPNDAGYQKVADRITPALEAVCASGS